MDQKNKSFQVRKPVLLSSDLILILFKLQSSAEDFPVQIHSRGETQKFFTRSHYLYIYFYIFYSLTLLRVSHFSAEAMTSVSGPSSSLAQRQCRASQRRSCGPLDGAVG